MIQAWEEVVDLRIDSRFVSFLTSLVVGQHTAISSTYVFGAGAATIQSRIGAGEPSNSYSWSHMGATWEPHFFMDPTIFFVDSTNFFMDPTIFFMDPTIFFMDPTIIFMDPIKQFVDSTKLNFVDPTKNFMDPTKFFMDPTNIFIGPTKKFKDSTNRVYNAGANFVCYLLMFS